MKSTAVQLPDTLREALGQVIADQRREWRREREVIEAQGRQLLADSQRTIAELRAQIVEMQAELRSRVEARLATVDVAAVEALVVRHVDELGVELAGKVEHFVEAAVSGQADIVCRLARTEIAAWDKDGGIMPTALVASVIEHEVARQIAALPPAEPGAPGKSVTIEDVAPMVEEAVGRAVAALPPPEPSKDIDPAEVDRLVDERVAAAVANIPTPEPGAPGKSVTAADVAPMIEEVVARAVGALPPAEPGKSVTIADVEPVILAAVEKAVAALPPPEPGAPGRSVTIEDVAPLVEEAVTRAVAEIPAAKDGAPGVLPLVDDWTDRVYQAGEAVSFEGSTFQAQRLTGKAPTHEDWRCIACAGRGGADGASLNPRSTWSAEETYAALDVVTLDGGAFVARRDDPGPCPGDGWMLLVQRGKSGKPGLPGAPGKGPKGDPGPAVVDLSIDETGMVTLTNADGSTLEHDFAPVLSRLGR